MANRTRATASQQVSVREMDLELDAEAVAEVEVPQGRMLIFDIKGRSFPMKVPSSFIFATVNGKTCMMTVRKVMHVSSYRKKISQTSNRTMLQQHEMLEIRFGAQGVLNGVCALPMFQVDGSIKIKSAR